MTGDRGGETGADAPALAPVIPLFGGRKGSSELPAQGPRGAPAQAPRGESTASSSSPQHPSRGNSWRTTWTEGDADSPDGSPSERHPAHAGSTKRTTERTPPRLRALTPHTDDTTDAVASSMRSRHAGSSAPGIEDVRVSADGIRESEGSDADADADAEAAKAIESAEAALVRKLRARSLSVSEARTVLRSHAVPGAQVDMIIDEFSRRGYLDDRTLAGHLVSSGTERKGLGRVALSRALAQRGIPRDVIDAALEELPNDDAERALDFARTKARALTRLDHETALRRLVGQLARRGYGGSVAMTAARTALDEAGTSGSSGGVRFVDSE